MQINIIIPQIIHEVWRHKLRSSLAVFCIAFGVFSVAMLSTLGESFCAANRQSIMGLADNALIVWFGSSSKSFQGYSKGQMNFVTIADVMELPKIFPSIIFVSPELKRTAALSHGGKVSNKSISGVSPQFVNLVRVKLSSGSRFINQLDVDNNSQVAVIGDKTKQILFDKGTALGEKFLINDIPFTVIGVISKDENGRGGFDKDLFISTQSFEKLYGDNKVYQFFVVTKPGANVVQVEQALRGYFARKCHFDKNDKSAIGFWDSSKVHRFFQWFFIVVQIFLWVCGLMILIVGSIGVANIMFLIVTERAYEIGLRKALGATDTQVLFQLFFEALVIIVVGGSVGVIAAFSTIVFLQHITLPSWIGIPTLSWITAIITIVTLGFVGLIAGFFPARRAAKMDPVEALMM